MIDFRYHLVSIISIFLALAVGIVLGAGPLKGSIGDSLAQELANTRQDKAALNDDLTASRRVQAAQNAFGGTVLPGLVAGRLRGEKIALVLGPRANDAAVKGISDAIGQAGGQVVTTVTLSGTMIDSASEEARAATIRPLVASLGLTTVPEQTKAGAVLGRALLQGGKGAPAATAATTTSVLGALTDAGLLKASAQPGVGGVPVPTLAVVLPGPVDTDPVAEQRAQTDVYLGLVRGLDTAAAGTVLVAPTATATNPGSASTVVAAARASNATAEIVSTVDDVDLPMGEAALVLALVGEKTGTAGRYGVRDDAQAVVPPVTR